MGAGKSTVGAELARCLGWPFHDLDTLIEAREGRTIAQIFQQQGELSFRQIESAALAELLSPPPASMVLALGGGAFGQIANQTALRRVAAKIVFLSASAGELWRRCALPNQKLRPLLQDELAFRQLLSERLPEYCQAHLTVNTEGKQVPQIAAEIESSLALFSH